MWAHALSMVQMFERINSRFPNYIAFTKREEFEFARLTRVEIGSIADRIPDEDVRSVITEAFQSHQNLLPIRQVRWRSKVCEVGFEDALEPEFEKHSFEPIEQRILTLQDFESLEFHAAGVSSIVTA